MKLKVQTINESMWHIKAFSEQMNK